MTFAAALGTDDCITQQDHEHDRYGNVSGGVSRVLTKVMQAETPVYPVKYEWIDTVPIVREGHVEDESQL